MKLIKYQISLILFSILILLFGILIVQKFIPINNGEVSQGVLSEAKKEKYWFILERKSNIEKLYVGIPGNKEKSSLVKTFQVKSGVPNLKPTPLPTLLGREYWLIIDEMDSSENPETSPYFLTLDIPVTEEKPYGPTPYKECDGQCDWELPGAFGLHGVNQDLTRLSNENPGSSGCVRHTDEDITFLYNLLDPKNERSSSANEGIRYYVEDV